MASRLLRAAVACLLTCGALGASASFTSITVFGDDYSDGGNVSLRTVGSFPPSPPYAQRFSNGPVAVEYLATGLGLPLTPSVGGGSNYAFGGAETGSDNYLRFPYPSFAVPLANTGTQAQVNGFLSALPPGFGGPSSLVVLWAGVNDLYSAPWLSTPLPDAAAAAVGRLMQQVQLLYGAGARRVVLPGMLDLGLLPGIAALGSTQAQALTGVALAFNTALHQAVINLEPALPGLDIIEFDSFGLLDQIVADPSASGFTNVTDPCLSSTICADPNSYLFWDSARFTTYGHEVFGAAMLKALASGGTAPEPPMALLLMGGAIGLLVARRVRAH